ncbi:MAG: septal ring lytic transglycosylase RlpA family protein [Patescibacteria group bacterium]|jgi:hypothetical protein
MVQIKHKLKYLILFSFFGILASSAQADVDVINTDFFHKISVGSINLTLVDWDKEIKQWVVDWHPVSNNVFELGLYPSNSTPAFSLSSAESWLYSPDQNNWQVLDNSTIKNNKIYLKKNTDSSSLPVEIVVDKDKELVNIAEYSDYQLPENIKLISRVYQLDSQKNDLAIKFYYQSTSNWHKQIFQYDPSLQTWLKLGAYNNVEEKFLKQTFSKLTGPIYLAVFEDETANDGVASFYDQSRYRSFGYKNGLYAASRQYPKGTKLKVTRLLSGKSVIVTVNDYGPESKTNRLIDMDKTAFKQIASLGAGLIYVKVEPI